VELGDAALGQAEGLGDPGLLPLLDVAQLEDDLLALAQRRERSEQGLAALNT
jgi:hypothetical protein